MTQDSMQSGGTRGERKSEISSSRRRILSVIGAGSVAGIAGCVGQTGEEDEDDAVKDRILHLPIHLGTRPREMQYNPWGKNYGGIPSLFEKMIDWDPHEEEYVPYTVDWEFDGDVWRLTPVDEAGWHNGDSITGRDLSIDFRMSNMVTEDTGIAKYYDEVTVDGDSVNLHLTADWSEEAMLFRLHGQRMDSKWDELGEFVETMEDATTEEELNDEYSELQDYRIEEPVGTGMFEYDDVRAQRLILTRWDDHHDADKVNFNEVRYRFYEEQQAMWSALQSGDLDMIYGNQVLLTKQMLDRKPDHVTEQRQARHGGLSVVPQHDDDQLGDLHVRKAMAYVINRTDAANNVSSYTENPAPTLTSISGPNQEKWLDGVIDDFTEYGPESKPEQAEEVLREGGYEKEDGTWLDPDGNPVEIPVHVSSDRDSWVTAARTVAEQLEAFGFDAELSADEPNSYWTSYLEGEFDKVVMGFWGHPAADMPFFQLWLSLLRVIPGEACHYPVENAEVPMPIGDPEGSTETLNLKEMIEEMEKLDDEDEIRDLVEIVAWAYNQTLPQLPLLQGVHQTAVSRDGWEMPDSDAPEMTNYHLEKVRLPNYLLRWDALSATE